MSASSAVSLIAIAVFSILHIQGCISIPGTKKWEQPKEGDERWKAGEAAATKIFECQEKPEDCEKKNCKDCKQKDFDKCDAQKKKQEQLDQCCDCEEVQQAIKDEQKSKDKQKGKLKKQEEKQLEESKPKKKKKKKKKDSLMETEDRADPDDSAGGMLIEAGESALEFSDLESESTGLEAGIDADLPAVTNVVSASGDIHSEKLVDGVTGASGANATKSANSSTPIAVVERKYHPVRIHGHDLPRRT